MVFQSPRKSCNDCNNLLY